MTGYADCQNPDVEWGTRCSWCGAMAPARQGPGEGWRSQRNRLEFAEERRIAALQSRRGRRRAGASSNE
jgi:hypothetical protein